MTSTSQPNVIHPSVTKNGQQTRQPVHKPSVHKPSVHKPSVHNKQTIAAHRIKIVAQQFDAKNRVEHGKTQRIEQNSRKNAKSSESIISPVVTKNKNTVIRSTFTSENVWQNSKVAVKTEPKKLRLVIKNPKKDQVYVLSELLNKGDCIKNLEINGVLSTVSKESSYVLVLKIEKAEKGEKIYYEL
jgi:hypothetical protein